MVDEELDRLVRRVAEPGSRRTLFASMAGAFGLALGLPAAAAANGCRPAGARCHQNAQCCSHICNHGTDTCAAAGSVRCNGKVVTCAEGQLLDPFTCTCNDPTICCAHEGEACISTEDCCIDPGSLFCDGGTCTFGS